MCAPDPRTCVTRAPTRWRRTGEILRTADGMTLVEVLLALVIIGVGLVALAAAIPIAVIGVHTGNQQSTATFLANQRLEQVRNTPWSNLTAANFPNENPVAVPFAGFTRQVQFVDCSAAPASCGGIADTSLRQVTVTVSYRPIHARGVGAPASQSVVLSTLVSQR